MARALRGAVVLGEACGAGCGLALLALFRGRLALATVLATVDDSVDQPPVLGLLRGHEPVPLKRRLCCKRRGVCMCLFVLGKEGGIPT